MPCSGRKWLQEDLTCFHSTKREQVKVMCSINNNNNTITKTCNAHLSIKLGSVKGALKKRPKKTTNIVLENL